jgi:hypothetical protein
MNKNKYYISFVVATRNDNHGGNMKSKNQLFIDNWINKTKKYNISSELILIEWNPLKKKLKDVLKIPKLHKNQSIRIITVPNIVHKTFKNSNKLSFYQMIAKNVGIRRSKGEFVLTTNIDIIFSEKIMHFFATKKLKHGFVYRVDRHDIDLKNLKIGYKSDKFYNKYIKLVNKKNYSLNIRLKKKHYTNYTFSSLLNKILNKRIDIKSKEKFIKLLKNFFSYLFKTLFNKKLHTNACGDFILLDSRSFKKLGGFDEFEGYSWHLDTLFMWKAYHLGIKFKNLKYKIFHLYQNIGSGYNPGSKKLFYNLRKKNIDYIDDNLLRQKIINPNYNDIKKDWGLKRLHLNETKLSQNVF